MIRSTSVARARSRRSGHGSSRRGGPSRAPDETSERRPAQRHTAAVVWNFTRIGNAGRVPHSNAPFAPDSLRAWHHPAAVPGSRSRSGRPEAARPLRQARPAALHVESGLPAGARAGAATGRCADGLLGWLPPAPQDQLRQRRIDRHGERGVLRAAGDRAGGPRVGAAALDEALPSGIDIVQVVEAGPGALADRLEASDWLVQVSGVPVNEVSEAVDRLLEREKAEVTRMTKSGPRTFDVRRAIVSARVQRPVEAAREVTANHDPARLCDTADGRTAHHTCRPPRRHSDRAA